MKFSRIALALAAFAAGTAHAALTPAEQAILNDANANGRVFFVSGASAVDAGFNSIIGSLFSGTPVRFANGTGFRAVAGTLAAGTGPWSGQNVIVINRTKGGSVFGVNPVARNEKIESLVVTAAACGATGAGTVASPYSCDTTGTADPATTGQSPDAGVSDVAPFIFQAPINTEGEPAAASLSAAELATMQARPIYGLAFGVPVTNTVPASVKFTRSTVAAIMTGNVANWAEVDAAVDGDIVICRRVPGSGTQAVMNLWAGNFPCGTSNSPADRDASSAWDPVLKKYTVTPEMGELIVIENSSSGDVRTCLNRAVTGGTYTTTDRNGQPVTVDFGSGGHKAIGVLSLDSLSSSTSTGSWQFRPLDGAGTYTWDNTSLDPVTTGTGKFPTKAVYENGDWDLHGVISFNVPNRTNANAAKKAVADKFLSLAQNPAILAGSTSLKNVAMAIPGGIYSGDQVLDAAHLNGDQCLPFNRNFND